MPTALVTGASGFLGSHLCLALEKLGWDVVALTRKPLSSRFARIRPLVGDILSTESLRRLSDESLDAVFHFAAEVPRGGGSSYQRFMEVNACGTAGLLDSFDRTAAKVFVYASGLSVVGLPRQLPVTESHPVNPLIPYHASKYAGEIACLEFGRRTNRRVVAFRITAPYGPGMPSSVLPSFLAAASAGRKLSVYGSGARVQNFVWAGDVAEACIAAVKKGNGCFNLGGPGGGISMLELARLACDTAGGSHDLIQTHSGIDPQEDYRFYVDSGKLTEEFKELAMTDIVKGIQKYNQFLKSQKTYNGWWA